MKTASASKKSNPAQSEHTVVSLTLAAPTAARVCIVGTFNDWRPDVTEMIRSEEGVWRKELSLLPGTYEYLFLADGDWFPDPNNRSSVPNPFGGNNSLLTVAATPPPKAKKPAAPRKPKATPAPEG